MGQGNWAACPWIAVLDPRVTTTTQEGVYPVVLIREDLSWPLRDDRPGRHEAEARARTTRRLRSAARARERRCRPYLAARPRLHGRRGRVPRRTRRSRGTTPSRRRQQVLRARRPVWCDRSTTTSTRCNRAYAALIEDGMIIALAAFHARGCAQVLAIYVGESARANFESGGRRGWWGWKRAPGDAERSTSGISSSSRAATREEALRVEAPEWQTSRRSPARGRTDRQARVSHRRGDHAGRAVRDAQYPWKLRFTILGEEPDVSLRPGQELEPQRCGGAASQRDQPGSRRRCAVAGSPLLERYMDESTAGCRGRRRRPISRCSPRSLRGSSRRAGCVLIAISVTAFLAGVLAKPFAILTGQSGSGKTQLAKRLGEWCGEDAARPPALPRRSRCGRTGPARSFSLAIPDGLAERVDDRVVWAVPETLEFLLRAHRDPRCAVRAGARRDEPRSRRALLRGLPFGH